MRCVPLFLLFVALTVVSLLCIATLVTILNTILVTEATRHAEDAVHEALSHAAGVVASPFDDTEPLVHRLASEALAASDFLNDGRTSPAAVAPTWRRYLGVDRGTQAPLYAAYQTFMVNASNYSWTFSGCFPDEWYRDDAHHPPPPNGIATMPTTGHPKLNLTIRSTDTGVATWNFTGSPFAERVRRLTAADKGGKWGDPELFYDQVTKATVPFITFHVPVLFDAQQRCLLSENIDLKANKIKAALLEIEVPATRFIVVHRSMGTLLATTFDLPPFNETVVPAPNPGGTPTVTTALWTATRTANSELNEATALLDEKNAIGFEQCLGRNKACACVEIRGSHIYGVRPVSRPTGLDLVVITVTPKSEFFATLTTARWLGIGIGGACAVVCVAVAALVTVLIKRALQQLQAAMVPAARLKCDPAAYRARGLSFVADIAELEEAFAVMNDKLHEAGAYLPQSVKAAWEAEDGEGPSPTDSFDDDQGHASDDTSSSAPFSDAPSKLPPGVHNARGSRSGGEEDLRSVSSEGTAMDSLSDILSTLTSGHSDDQAARTAHPQPQHLEPRRATVGGGQGARKACPSQGASPLSTASSYDERSASPRPPDTKKRWCGVGPTSHGAAVAPATTATHTNSPAGAGANTTGAFSPPAKTSLLNPLTSRRHMGGGGAAPASSTASATTATFSSGGRNGGGGNNNANNSPSDALPVPRRIKPKQRCTVVHLSVVGFQRIAEAAQFDEIARRSEATTDLVVTTAKAFRGVIDAFTGDSFVVTFNAVTQCSSHQRKGAAFVFALREAMQEVTRKERDGTLFRAVDQTLEGSRDAVKPMSTSLRAAPTVTFKKMSTSGAAAAPSGHFNLPLSCGMASGTVTIGDLGSRAMRRVSVIGKAPAHAAVLERLCRAYIDTAWSAAARRHQDHSMSAGSGSNQNQSQLLQSLQQQQQQQAPRGSEAVPQVFGPDCFTANAFARRRSHAAKATKPMPHEPSVAAPAPAPHGGFEEKETLQDDQASLMAPSTVSNSEDELVTSRSASVKKSGAFVVASAVAAPIAIEGDSQNPSPAFGSLTEHPAPSFTVSTSNMNGVAGAKLRGQLRTPHKSHRGSNSVMTDIALPDGCGGVSCSTLRDFGCGPVPCVVSQSLVEDLSVNFSSEVVDFIRLPQQRAATFVSVLTAPKGNEAEEANDEWLYVIPGSNDAGAESDAANALEKVVSRAASGQLRRAADAAPYLQSYLARHGVTPATVAANGRGCNAPAWTTPHTGSTHDGTASASGFGVPGRACMACAMAALASRNAGRLMHQHSKERAEGPAGKTAYAGRALGDYYDHSVGGALC